ncbi:hypothetical protein GSI_03559 [Ganoderma sinense ZZ0214-1]|uniref:Uncharacterized protein n=1 Tax=Ganoderma sinense ZZ0214-1 TaxID=1077348 RepID=A0A2G8SJB2_9APHY|nr:hypothetical protein GSI_03559 [Ganoderma sinense ZZ0214-1]
MAVAQCYSPPPQPALPSLAFASLDPAASAHAVLPDPRSPPGVSHVPHIPHVDTASSPSLTDSSTASDENTSTSTSPIIMDVLDACLAELASEQWLTDTDTAVWAWDTLLEQQQYHRSPAVSQMLFEDPELRGWIETLQIPPVAVPVHAHGPPPASSSSSSSRPVSVSPGPFLT